MNHKNVFIHNIFEIILDILNHFRHATMMDIDVVYGGHNLVGHNYYLFSSHILVEELQHQYNFLSIYW